MKLFSITIILFLTMALSSCNLSPNPKSIELSKQEILKTEKDFEACVKNEGIAAAFTKFAAEDAVLNRNDKIVKGIERCISHSLEKTIRWHLEICMGLICIKK